MINEKVCSKCKQKKSLSEFYKDKSRRDGHKVWCKKCDLVYQQTPKRRKRIRDYTKEYYEKNKERHEEYRNRYRYGLTTKERKALIALVGHCCEACGIKEEYLTKGLFIHHNHQTNKVEGVLCSNCNFALGLLGNDPTHIRALLAFLERVKGKEGKDE